jgi:HSP20 family protein
MSYLGTTNNKVFERFGDDIDHFFDRSHFLGRSPFRKSWLTSDKAAANLSKNEEGYHLQIALPGFKKEAVKIKVENGILSILATKGNFEESGKDFIVKEFHHENTYRSFTLGDTIDEDSITAKLEDGMLDIFLPSKTPHEPTVSKSIQIQ